MSLSCVLFEMKCFSCHFVAACQLACGPSIMVILAHQNNPQSGGLRFGFFFFVTRSYFICPYYCRDDFIDAERVNELVNNWLNAQLFYLECSF